MQNYFSSKALESPSYACALERTRLVTLEDVEGEVNVWIISDASLWRPVVAQKKSQTLGN